MADQVDSERRMAAVLSAIRRLPQREQDVLALVTWTGLSYEQAAAALDVPVGTVRSRLSRARRRLASSLASLDDAASTHPRTGGDHA